MTIVNMVGGGSGDPTFSFIPEEYEVPPMIPMLGFTANISGFSGQNISGLSGYIMRYEQNKAFIMTSGTHKVYDLSGATAVVTSQTVAELGTISPYPLCKMDYGFVYKSNSILYIVDSEGTGHRIDAGITDIAYDGENIWGFVKSSAGLVRRLITIDTTDWTVTLGDAETVSTVFNDSTVTSSWLVTAMFGDEIHIYAKVSTGTRKYEFNKGTDGWTYKTYDVSTSPSNSSQYGIAQKGVGYRATTRFNVVCYDIPGGMTKWEDLYSSTYRYATWYWGEWFGYGSGTPRIYQMTDTEIIPLPVYVNQFGYLAPTEGLNISGSSTYHCSMMLNGKVLYWEQ